MTQTQLIHANLPLYYQCLRVPAEWRPAERNVDVGKELLLRDLLFTSDLLKVRPSPIRGSATAYDPWEKRDEFFRLKRDDMEGLLAFLNSVGLFKPATGLHGLAVKSEFADDTLVYTDDGLPYNVRYLSKVRAATIWSLRTLVQNSLRKSGEKTGEYSDFQARIVRMNGQPQVVLTTTTFMEALLLTLVVDRVSRAKVRKCVRPDCGVLFSNTGGHKRKFCSWYCGHIESVRKQRRKAKQKGGKPKGKQQKINSGVKHGKKTC